MVAVQTNQIAIPCVLMRLQSYEMGRATSSQRRLSWICYRVMATANMNNCEIRTHGKAYAAICYDLSTTTARLPKIPNTLRKYQMTFSRIPFFFEVI